MDQQHVASRWIVMTGGTSGLGAVAAETFAHTPGVRLVLGARKGTQEGIDRLPLDLERLDSVRSFAAAVVARLAGDPIDVLVLNAGTAFSHARNRTIDGFETTFAVNHLSHYLLLRLLAPYLALRATVIITTSNLHDPRTNRLSPPTHADAETLAHPDRHGVNTSARLAGMRAYSASKLCNLLTVRGFACRDQVRRLDPRVIAFNPGLTPETGLMRDSPAVIRAIARALLPILMPVLRLNTLEASGGALADLALGAVVPPQGHLYASLEKRSLAWREPSELASHDEVMDRLWYDSARLTSCPDFESGR